MADLISVVVSTYNRKEALDVVLHSRQTDQQFEVVVDDDSLAAASKSLIEKWSPHMPVTLKHVWHEHRGFRLAEIRNRAISASAGPMVFSLIVTASYSPTFCQRIAAQPNLDSSLPAIVGKLSQKLSRRVTRSANVGFGSDSAVAATLAARPVYPRKLTTCCNAQVVSLGPKPTLVLVGGQSM
jgi:Glycosyl transferase family 2